MSYKESVLIPYEIFEKCTFEKPYKQQLLGSINSKSRDLPVDKRVKLKQQEKNLNLDSDKAKLQQGNMVNYETVRLSKDIENITNSIPLARRPFARSILEKMKQNKDIAVWNDKYEFVYHNLPIQDSNIMDLMHFIQVDSPNKPIPKGFDSFLNALLYELQIPHEWLLTNILTKFKAETPDQDEAEREEAKAESSDDIERKEARVPQKLIKTSQGKKEPKKRKLIETEADVRKPKKDILKQQYNDILTHVPESRKEYSRKILDQMKMAPEIIDWDDNYQIIYHGETIPGTSLVNILPFLQTNDRLSRKGTPEGALTVYKTLLNELDIPRQWVLRTFPRQSGFDRDIRKKWSDLD